MPFRLDNREQDFAETVSLFLSFSVLSRYFSTTLALSVVRSLNRSTRDSYSPCCFMEPRSVIVTVVVVVFFSLALIAVLVGFGGGDFTGTTVSVWLGLEEGTNNTTLHIPHRKLLRGETGSGRVKPNQMWGDKCSKSDIVINQGPTAPLPSGIPTYTVEIMNIGVSGCDISAIHLRCGWFSSARLINPKIFKRLRYNDCLVNDGRPLNNGGSISFQYANTFLYPLSVSSVVCV